MLKIHHVKAGEVLGESGKVLGMPEDYRCGVNVVTWVIEGGVLKPEELANIEEEVKKLVSSLDSSKPVIVSGRGPHWLYGVFIHNLHFFPVVATWEPRIKKGVIVEATSKDLLGKAVGLDGNVEEVVFPTEVKGVLRRDVLKMDDYQIIHNEVYGDRFIHPKELKALAEEDLSLDPGKPVIIEGMMPIWLGAFYTAQLVHKTPALGFYDPRLKGGVVFATHAPDYNLGQIIELDLAKALRKEPLIVGVVGHPNSGKSVALHLLNSSLRGMGLTTLTQEADLFAPTQEWSLHAPEVRKELKKHMSPEERLEWVINSLETAKRSGGVDVVLVDIGGGRPDLGQLVTKENLAILQRVDAVLIVSREGITDWLRELKTYAPHVKIAAVMKSSLQGQAFYNPSMKGGVLVGLDRKLYHEGKVPEETVKAVDEIAKSIAGRKFATIEDVWGRLARFEGDEIEKTNKLYKREDRTVKV